MSELSPVVGSNSGPAGRGPAGRGTPEPPVDRFRVRIGFCGRVMLYSMETNPRSTNRLPSKTSKSLDGSSYINYEINSEGFYGALDRRIGQNSAVLLSIISRSLKILKTNELR